MLIHSAVDYQHPCHWHRCILPFRYLSRDHPQHQWILGTEDSGCEIDCCWVYGCRPFDRLVEFDRLRREGVKVIWTLDDLYFDFPYWRKKKPTEEQIAFCRLMPSVADLCIYSTPFLAAQHPHPEKSVVAPNLMEVAAYGVTEPKLGERVRVLWAGASGHSGDLDLIDDALCRLREEFPPDQLEFLFFGTLPSRLGRDYFGKGVRLFRHIELADYAKAVASLQPHICLAPLADCPFNRAKTNIRVLEAWSLAAVPVASPVGEYRLIEDGVDGFLCDCPEDWDLVLSQLVRDPELRYSVAKKGRERVAAEWDWANPEARLRHWGEAGDKLNQLFN